MKINVGYWLGEAENLIYGMWRWRKARSFADMLRINIASLTRERDDEAADPSGDPAYWQRLCTEIALNRCGLLTEFAAGGGRNESAGFEYRAVVDGLAEDDTLRWLTGLLRDSPYQIQSHTLHVPAPGDTETTAQCTQRTGLLITRRIGGDGEHIHLGGLETARELFMLHPVRRAAGRQLRAAHRVTVYDPAWGDSDLFSFLLTAALDRQQSTAQK